MDLVIKVSFKGEWGLVVEYSNGATVRFMMVNGKKVGKQVVVCGQVLKVKAILANGSKIKLKDLVCLWWIMAVDMKESSKTL